jgi:hypothetical protein
VNETMSYILRAFKEMLGLAQRAEKEDRDINKKVLTILVLILECRYLSSRSERLEAKQMNSMNLGIN